MGRPVRAGTRFMLAGMVTMGCGDHCRLIPGKRYLDWDLPDPKDRPIDEVRSIRDDIATRVIALITELDAGDRPTDEPRFERASARRPYDSAINRLGIPLACRSTHASSAGSPAPPSGLMAVAAHGLEYPHCAGQIKIISRSEHRSRASHASLELAAAPAMATSTPDEPSAPIMQARSATGRNTLVQGFRMRERVEADETVRLILLGELDLAVGDELTGRLRQLRDSGRSVRLDLSKLAFIDSSGLRTLLLALTKARSDGWHLEIMRRLSPSVERVAQIVGVARVLWPDDPERGAADQASRSSSVA